MCAIYTLLYTEGFLFLYFYAWKDNYVFCNYRFAFEHRGVQNPCYRSIVSNTDTFEILAVDPGECLCSPWNSSKRTAGAMIMSPSSDRNQIQTPEKWLKSIWSSAASRQIWGRIRRIPSPKTCRRCRAASLSWPLQPVELGQKNLVDAPRSLLTWFGNQLTGVLPHNLKSKNAIHENVDSVLSCLMSDVWCLVPSL